MKKSIIIGVILVAIGIIAIIFGFLNAYAFYHAMDGSLDMFNRLKKTMVVHLASGTLIFIAGIITLLINSKR